MNFQRLTLCIGLMALGLNNAHAERYMAFMGAGGEPKQKNSTIFDGSITAMNDYLGANKWNQVKVSFNGGHSVTEALLNMTMDNAEKSNFTAESYNSTLDQYEAQIKEGKIKPGDQLLIMINTHGAMKTSEDSTHQIAVGGGSDATNLNDLKGTQLVKLDRLKNLSDLAAKKGIKLGIVDFSCHSGNSLSLANESTCVISSTGKSHFGYSSFADNFINRMKSGKTLEDIFLETRKNTSDNSFPMISTTEGEAINKNFYPVLTPYLYYYEEDPNVDKMTNYLLEASTNTGVCARQTQYGDLLKQLDTLEALSALNLNKSLPEIGNLRSMIKDYKKKQDDYIALLRSWGTTEVNRRESFNATAKVGRKSHTMDITYSWKEILETDVDTIIKNVSRARSLAKEPADQAQFQASIDLHTKIKHRQMELLAQFPNLKDYKEKLKLQLINMKGTYDVANKIALEERKLYEAMYETQRTMQKKQKNPCKDFKL